MAPKVEILVIQQVDGQPFVTETVQKKGDEMEAHLGITGLSVEDLVQAYKVIMKQLHKQSGHWKSDVIVTMTSGSAISGEIRAHFVLPDAPVQTPLQVRYRHYYVLNALRERMIETLGEPWKSVRVVYHEGGLDFFFEY